MKKFAQLSFVMLALLLVFTGCKKKDTDTPVITLEGDADVVIALGSVYQDEGATAFDEVDGDLTNKIIVESNVDESRIGKYQVTYTVEDARENSTTVTRNVTVAILQENYLGAYNVGNPCGALWLISGSQSVAADTSSNAIVFGGFYSGGVDVTATISGQNITIPNQTDGLTTISGYGTINDVATTIILNISLSNAFSTEDCALTYTRQ